MLKPTQPDDPLDMIRNSKTPKPKPLSYESSLFKQMSIDVKEPINDIVNKINQMEIENKRASRRNTIFTIINTILALIAAATGVISLLLQLL